MAKPDKIDMQKCFEDIASGMSIKKACDKQGVSNKTFYDKLDECPELKNDYARCKERRGEAFSDSIEEDLDKLSRREIDPATARVLIDTKKWFASKFYPKMYGEKQSVEVTGANGGSISVTQELDIEKIKQLKEMLGA